MSLYIGAVDDDPDILYTIEAMASTQGWHMVTSVDPETSLEWISSREVDILLVDFHMPGMNGLEVVKKARQLSDEVVIIALTIEDDENIASELLLAGADDFITKPLHLADFKSRIRLHGKLVHQRRSLNWDERQKGINKDTLRMIMAFLKEKKEEVTWKEISCHCEISHATAHRYLEYLANRGAVLKVSIYRDGKPGRPMSAYRWSNDG